MAANVEIKARCTSLDEVRRLAAAAGAVETGVLHQTDRYFELDGPRRVKLRTFGPTGSGSAERRAELIEYDRPEVDGVRVSNYVVTPVRRDGACAVPKGKPLVVVCKRRELWMLDNVRIHLDEVEDLGGFVELEAVVDGTHDEERCRRQVDELLVALAIGPADLIRASYSDLLLERGEGG